jgi:hypothetical protein
MSGLRALRKRLLHGGNFRHLREDREEPFERAFDMGMAMLRAKRHNTDSQN